MNRSYFNPWQLYKALCGITLLVACTSAVAGDPPKREQSDIVAVTWFNNFTYAGWTTATGLLEGAFSVAANKLGDPKKYHGFRMELDPSGQQLIVFPAGLAQGHSSGAFNLANGRESEHQSVHEAGHGKQAAILGPLFIPVLLASYGVNSLRTGGDTHDGNPFESWANAWKYLGSSMVNNRSLALRLDKVSQDGKTVTRLGTNFIYMERSSKLPLTPFNGNYSGTETPKDNPSQKKDDPVSTSYKYGQVGVHVSVGEQECNHSSIAPLKIEGTLFQQDFLAEWATISSALRLLIDAKQETGRVVVDLDYRRIDAKFLSQSLGIGLRIGNKETVAVDMIGRGNGEIKGLWRIGDHPDKANAGIVAAAGVGGEIRLHLFDAAEVYARTAKEWGTNEYTRNADSIGVETPMLFTAKTYTGFEGHSGSPVSITGGVYHETETETAAGPSGPGNTTHVKMTIFTLGGRF